MNARIVPLEGVSNFRDFGGYRTTGEATLKSGKLYRSAHHGRASDADLEAIAALDIAVVVDLRRPTERAREPSRRHPNFRGRVIDNDIGDLEEDPWHAFVRASDLSGDSFRGHAMDYYRAAPFECRHVDLFRRYFEVVARADGPVLIHCAAGKDRTGLLAALTHQLVGVHEDDIVADFLLTNEAVHFERLIPTVSEMMFEQTGRWPTPAAVRVAMSVEAAYLHTAFTAIKDAYGSVDAYLANQLGVDAAMKSRLEMRLLA